MHPHDDVPFIYKHALKHGDRLIQKVDWWQEGQKTNRFKVQLEWASDGMETNNKPFTTTIILSPDWKNSHGDGWDKMEKTNRLKDFVNKVLFDLLGIGKLR